MNPLKISEPKLQSVFQDSEIEDILLRPKAFAYFKNSRWHGPFESDECSSDWIWDLSRTLAESNSQTLSLTLPVVDAICEISKGVFFRAHVCIEPFVECGPEICLRRIQGQTNFSLKSFIDSNNEIERIRRGFIDGQSLLIAGATGSGKSSFLACLLNELRKDCRVILLEDSKELPLPNKLCTRLLTRSDRFAFREGVQWGLEDLLRESLRMRPDRLILGECRGPEAKIILSALSTGHQGLATTIHAGNVVEAVSRFNHLAESQQKSTTQNPWDMVLTLSLKNGHREISDFYMKESSI
jgi:pilus assembly protein CpaF